MLWPTTIRLALDNSPLRSPHGDGGTNVVLADGSVHYLESAWT